MKGSAEEDADALLPWSDFVEEAVENLSDLQAEVNFTWGITFADVDGDAADRLPMTLEWEQSVGEAVTA